MVDVPLRLVAALGLGAAFALALYAITHARAVYHEVSQGRLRSIRREVPPPETTQSGGSRARWQRGSFDRRLGRVPLTARMQAQLRRAGLSWEVKDYVGIVTGSGLGLALFLLALTRSPLLAMLGFAFGAAFPVVLVRRRGARRTTQLNDQVVDAVDLVASSLRAGFGFIQGLELAASEQADPMAAELRQVMREIHLGVSTEEALERLVARTGDADLALVVNAVLIQRRVGGNLAEVLGNIATMIRDRTRVRGEIRTLTAQARMSGWIVGLLPIALGAALTIMQPDHMSVLFTDPAGRQLTAVALGLETVGFLLVRRLARVDY